MQAVYYELKDARNSARTTERSAVGDDPIGIVPLWNSVNTSAIQLTELYTKDLEVLCWLAEAQIRLRGFEGLADSLELITSLVTTHWPDLHSVAREPLEDKVAPLTGLNGLGGEGVLIQSLRLAPLIPGETYGRFGLWDYQKAQRPGETSLRDSLYQAASEAGGAEMRTQLAHIDRCVSHFSALTEMLDETCGKDAPPSSNIRHVLQEASQAIREMAGIDNQAEESGSAKDVAEAGEPAKTDVSIAPPRQGSIQSREEAFEILLGVARFFRRTEPHSPTAQALETLVRRGRMDFQELLNELLPDASTRASVLTAAGIQPKVDKNGG